MQMPDVKPDDKKPDAKPGEAKVDAKPDVARESKPAAPSTPANPLMPKDDPKEAGGEVHNKALPRKIDSLALLNFRRTWR